MPEPAPAGRHRAGIRIGERYLLIGRGKHLFSIAFRRFTSSSSLASFSLSRVVLAASASDGASPAEILAVGGVELAQIARDTLLDLRQAAVHLSFREVVIA